MKSNSQVDCYFYKGHPDLVQPIMVEDDTVWIRISERLDTVYEKTLLAFQHFLPELHKYDFVLRSNLSTLVSFPHLLQFCNELPKQKACAAVIGHHVGIPFPAGNAFILSIDLIRRLVEERPPLIEQDDVSIGAALQKWGVPIVEFIRPDYCSGNLWTLLNYQRFKNQKLRAFPPTNMMFTWRLKSSNREEDIAVMSVLIDRLYKV
jgi:hypothetical protein